MWSDYKRKVVYLSGGVGGAKLALGLASVLGPERLTIIVNVGDDFTMLGLRICPDLDTVLYTLGDQADATKGWGIDQDTFHCLEFLESYGWDAWFRLGDKDLATHLWRTHLIQQGVPLAAASRKMAEKLGVSHLVLPATEDYTPTHLITSVGCLHLQEYFVRERCGPVVKEIEYKGAEKAKPASGVRECLAAADLIIFGPSNPLISIGPILAIPMLLESILARKCPLVAVSPVIGGRALKGPAAKMLAELGWGASSVGVARYYAGLSRNLLDLLIVDQEDCLLQPEIESLGIRVEVADTVMNSKADKVRLAKEVLTVCSQGETAWSPSFSR